MREQQMGKIDFKAPVGDSVPKVNEEVAVGEDIEFQRKWWVLEKIVWTTFLVILALTVLGLFGRGLLATTRKSSADSTIRLKYDRIARTGTPADLNISFGPAAIHDGEIHLFLSESVITQLGAQRISPQPEKSTVGNGGITYTFPATKSPATVIISLQPPGPGSFAFEVSLPDTGSSLDEKVIVVP
jgi:hypothetical protein